MKIKIWDPHNEDEAGAEVLEAVFCTDNYLESLVQRYAEGFYRDCAGEWKGGTLHARIDDGELLRFNVRIEWSPDFYVSKLSEAAR